MSTATLRRNRHRGSSTLPTLPAHVHQAAIWLGEDGGIAALLIDRATAQHLLGMPDWRLVESPIHSRPTSYCFAGPAGSIHRHPDHKGWFLFYPEFKGEN